jgi:hypothetical protein
MFFRSHLLQSQCSKFYYVVTQCYFFPRHEDPFFVIASRLSEPEFFRQTNAGIFLSQFDIPRENIFLYSENSRGLSTCYNEAMDELRLLEGGTVVFQHDDVALIDFFWMQRLEVALRQVDLVGLVGSVGGSLGQPSWLHSTCWSVAPGARLRGMLGHGHVSEPPWKLSVFGRSPARVDVVDGAWLALDLAKIPETLRFDENFDFHFYDMDFCRAARSAGCSLGVVDIAAIHQSEGVFGSPSWHAAYEDYKNKWAAVPIVHGP